MKRLSPEALLTQDADIILIGRLSQHHPQTATPPTTPTSPRRRRDKNRTVSSR